MLSRSLLLTLAVATVGGCALSPREACDAVRSNIIMPEQRSIAYHDPAQLPPAPLPESAPPRTVSEPRLDTAEWRLSLDEALRVALENARVVRTLAGTSAVSSGQTIYDPAISNTLIDQQRARFDPVLSQTNLWSRTNTPTGVPDPADPRRSLITSTPTDAYNSNLNLTKTNVLGGQWGLSWAENPTHVNADGLPLNPQDPHSVTLSYTQPLLQGAGFLVNTAPIVIARINTEQSYFQYKDSVQEMVRGVVAAYWNLVQARTDAWARKIQVEQSKEAFDREQARLRTGLADTSNVAQARVTYHQFRANQVAADAAVLTQEGALRNIMGLPPADDRRLVPVSAPASLRLGHDWANLVRLAEQRRPDLVELKLVLEADRWRLLQAENQALPQVNATALYRWNGLSGSMPNGETISTTAGQYTDWSVGVNFSVPLGLRAERASVRQQRLLLERDQANLQQGVHAAVHDLAATVRDLDSAYEQYLAYKETRAAADSNVRVQSEKFRAGQTIYFNVLQALNDWGNAVSAEAQQLLTYNTALATLERQTGTILETHGLVFEEERFRAAGPLLLPACQRAYPSAVIPSGVPHGYPASAAPSEEAFDLKNPAPRETKLSPVPPPPPASPRR